MGDADDHSQQIGGFHFPAWTAAFRSAPRRRLHRVTDLANMRYARNGPPPNLPSTLRRFV